MSFAKILLIVPYLGGSVAGHDRLAGGGDHGVLLDLVGERVAAEGLAGQVEEFIVAGGAVQDVDFAGSGLRGGGGEVACGGRRGQLGRLTAGQTEED